MNWNDEFTEGLRLWMEDVVPGQTKKLESIDLQIEALNAKKIAIFAQLPPDLMGVLTGAKNSIKPFAYLQAAQSNITVQDAIDRIKAVIIAGRGATPILPNLVPSETKKC